MHKIISIIISSFLLFSFVFNQSVYAFVDMRIEYTANNQLFNSSLIPTNYGKTVEEHFTGSDRIIINIQDLHCHPQTQRNISSIIELLDKKYGITNIYLEGAHGQVNTTWARNISKDKQIQIINKLIDSGRLTGAEYYSIKSDKHSLIRGLENKQPYSENLKTLSNLLSKQDEINLILQSIENSTYNLKQKYYSKELLKLEKLSQKYHKNKISAKKYYDLLLQQATYFHINLQQYKNILAYIKILELQKQINTKTINNQLISFLLNLKQHLPYSTYKALLNNTSNFSQIDKLYEYLIKLEQKYDLQMQKHYPQLYQYFQLTLLHKQLNPIEFIKEEDFLVKTVSEKYAITKAQKEVIFLTYFYKYLCDYLNTKITADDYQYYQDNINIYKSLWSEYVDNKLLTLLDNYIKETDKFYKINLERNYYFTNNIFNNTKQPNKKLSNQNSTNLTQETQIDIVITGGFHSQTINQILKDKNISYIVVTPNINGNIEFANNVYNNLVKEQGNIAYQTFAAQPFSSLSKEEKIKIVSFSFGKDIAIEMFGQYIEPQTNEIEMLQKTSDKLHKTILEIQEKKFLNLDDTKSAIEILEEMLNEKLDPQIIEFIDFDRLTEAFNKINYVDDVKSIVDHAKKLYKAFSTLQSNSTKNILDRIGQIIYKNNLIKAQNFKYSTIGLMLTSLFELFTFWDINFVSKYHQNNTSIMHIAHGIIMAISIITGVSIIFNPISNIFIVPAIFGTEFVLHFVYDFITVKFNLKNLLQSNLNQTNNEPVTLTQEELVNLKEFITIHTSDQRIIPSDIDKFLEILKEIDFNDLLTSYGTIPIFKNNKSLALKNNLLSFFSDQYVTKYTNLGYNNYNYLCATLIRLVLYNKDMAKKINDNTYRMIFSAHNNASNNNLTSLKVFPRLAAYVDWKQLCNDESSTDPYLKSKSFLHSLMHIYESHSSGFNSESNQKKQFYDVEFGESGQDFAVSYKDIQEIPNIISEPDIVLFTNITDYSNNITFAYIKKIDNNIYFCMTNSLGNVVSFYKLSPKFYLENNLLNLSNIIKDFSYNVAYVNKNSTNVNHEAEQYNIFKDNFENIDDLTKKIKEYCSRHTIFIKDHNLCIKNNSVYNYVDRTLENILLHYNESTKKFETNKSRIILFDTDEGQIIQIKGKYFYSYGKYLEEIQKYNGPLKTTSDFYFVFLDNLYSISSDGTHFTQIPTDEQFKLQINAINKVISKNTDDANTISEDLSDNNKSKKFNAVYHLLKEFLSKNNVNEKDINEDTIDNFIKEQESLTNDIVELTESTDSLQEQIKIELEFAIFGTESDNYSLFEEDINNVVNQIDNTLGYSKEKWIALILQYLITKYGDDFDFENIYDLDFYKYNIITINDYIEKYINIYTLDESNIQQIILDKIKNDFFGTLNNTDENKIKKIIERHFNNEHECISYFELNTIIAIILNEILEKNNLPDLPTNIHTPHVCENCNLITTPKQFVDFYQPKNTINIIRNNKTIPLRESVLSQLYYGILGNKEFNKQKSKIIEYIEYNLDDNLSIEENIANILKYLIDNGLNHNTDIIYANEYNNIQNVLDFIKQYDIAYFLQQKRNDTSVKSVERIYLELEYGILGKELYNKYVKYISNNITYKIQNSKYQEYYLAYILEKLLEDNNVKEINKDTPIVLSSMYDGIQTIGTYITIIKGQEEKRKQERLQREEELNQKKEAKKIEKQKENNIKLISNSRAKKVDSTWNKTRIDNELYDKIRIELSYGLLNEDIFKQNAKQIKEILKNIPGYLTNNEHYFNFVLSTILVQLINDPTVKNISYKAQISIPELYLNATTIEEFIKLSSQNFKNNKEQIKNSAQNINIVDNILLNLYSSLDYDIYFKNINEITLAINYVISCYFVQEDDNYDTNLLTALVLKQLLNNKILDKDTQIMDNDNIVTITEFIDKYATVQKRMELSLDATEHIKVNIAEIDDIILKSNSSNIRNFEKLETTAKYNIDPYKVFSRIVLLDYIFPFSYLEKNNYLYAFDTTREDVISHIDDLVKFIQSKTILDVRNIVKSNKDRVSDTDIINSLEDQINSVIKNDYLNLPAITLRNYIEILNLYNVLTNEQKEVIFKKLYPNIYNSNYDDLLDRLTLTPKEYILLRSFVPVDAKLYGDIFNCSNITESELLEQTIFAFFKIILTPIICYDFKLEIMEIIKEEIKSSNVKDIYSPELNKLINKIIYHLIQKNLVDNKLLDTTLDKRLYPLILKNSEDINNDDIQLLNDIITDTNTTTFNRLYAYMKIGFDDINSYDISVLFSELIEREFINIKQKILSNNIYEVNALLDMIFNNKYNVQTFTNLRNMSNISLFLWLAVGINDNEGKVFNKHFTLEDAQNIIISSNLNFTDYILLFMIYNEHINNSYINVNLLSQAMVECVNKNPNQDNFEIWKEILSKYMKLTYKKKFSYKKCRNVIELFDTVSEDILKFNSKLAKNVSNVINVDSINAISTILFIKKAKAIFGKRGGEKIGSLYGQDVRIKFDKENNTLYFYLSHPDKRITEANLWGLVYQSLDDGRILDMFNEASTNTPSEDIIDSSSTIKKLQVEPNNIENMLACS